MKKVLLSICLLLLVLTGCGEKESKPKVGIIQLVQHEALDNATQGFIDALKEAMGDDIIIEDVKNASGDIGTCSVMATDLVAEGVDLIMANATPALQAAAHATNTIPILGTSVTEYSVALDLDNYDGIVGGNVSGTSDLAPLDEQAQMILDLLPNTKSVGILYCSAEANSLYQVKAVKEFLEGKGVTVNTHAFTDSNDVDAVAKAACNENDALYIPTDNTCASNGEVIKNAASENAIPIIVGEKECCIAVGGLATLSIDYYELGKTTGNMAARILKGEDISTMKVEYYANPVKMISSSKANEFGITIPSDYETMD